MAHLLSVDTFEFFSRETLDSNPKPLDLGGTRGTRETSVLINLFYEYFLRLFLVPKGTGRPPPTVPPDCLLCHSYGNPRTHHFRAYDGNILIYWGEEGLISFSLKEQ
jgi:hypothetical protein